MQSKEKLELHYRKRKGTGTVTKKKICNRLAKEHLEEGT